VRENHSHITLAALAYAPLLKTLKYSLKDSLHSSKTQKKSCLSSFR